MAKWSELQKGAVKLSKEGWAVFPGVMVDGKKKPMTPNGFHDATTDYKTIIAWDWDRADFIAAAVPEGQFVVDIDARHDGDKTQEALKNAGLAWPTTRVHKTQGGGTHWFYELDYESEKNCRLKGKLGPGIDIKAGGKGYVVVPPSPKYEVISASKVAHAPGWMLDELIKPDLPTDTSFGGLPKFFDQWEVGTEYGTKAMEGEIGRLLMTPVGERNNALNRASFSLGQLAAGGELSHDEALSRLEMAGRTLTDNHEEVEQTIRSGWESGLQEPREAPSKDSPIPPAPVRLREEDFSDIGSEGKDHTEDHFWLDWENADDSPPPFYLHPLVPKNAYVLVYGATEASKSMVFMALAVQGSHLGIRSSIYSLENPQHIDIDRVRRLAPSPENFRISNMMLDLNDPRQVHSMIEREQANKTDWLIVDTYSHAFNTRSEDGNAKAIEFARRVRYIMSKVGCSFILLDHTGYSDHGEPRDASAKRQQVDVAIKMDRTVPWQPGQPARFSAECTKSARFGNPFYLRGRIEDVKPGRGLKLAWESGHAPKWEVDES